MPGVGYDRVIGLGPGPGQGVGMLTGKFYRFLYPALLQKDFLIGGPGVGFFCRAVVMVGVLSCSAAGGPLWEEVHQDQVSLVWKQLANERVMYPMEMLHRSPVGCPALPGVLEPVHQ